ncbi:MAG: IPT/TIG domain-containing protein [Acidobacteriota bacterium]|nr:IPT/TIG domain-containing protein [Acidobacteriota bacterium]
MFRNRAHHYLLALVCICVPVLLFAYATGPDAGYAGVPGESTCANCHSGGKGSGSVSVKFPNGLNYTPGVAQNLVVTVSDPVQRRWGFQLAARQAGNSTTQAGQFTPGGDGYTQLVCTSPAFFNEQYGNGCMNSATYPLQYIEHTLAGTRYGQGSSASFSFTWTPPADSTGNIAIYVAGNAANGDGNTSGDHIYTANYTLSPAAATSPTLPTIAKNGVVNAAGYQPTIQSGSWVAITGTNLSSTTRTWTAADFVNGNFPTNLDGASVTINGNPAYVEYVSPTQINVQAPTDSSTGPVPVQVTNSNGTSPVAMVTLQSASPAFFVWGARYVAATRVDYSYVGPPGLFGSAVTTTPAKPGDTLILWGTGFGPTNPAVPAGQNTPSTGIATPADGITVAIGGIQAQVLGAALTPGVAGVYQIVVQVPPNAPNGNLQVSAQVAGLFSPPNIFLAVQQ